MTQTKSFPFSIYYEGVESDPTRVRFVQFTLDNDSNDDDDNNFNDDDDDDDDDDGSSENRPITDVLFWQKLLKMKWLD